jgi:putative ABC transport system permease protein
VLFAMAWKNIWRNKTRSAIIIAAISLGLLGGMLASGVSFGMGDQMIAAAIDTRLSHLQIHGTGFRESRDIADTIPGASSLAAKITAMDCVAGVARRTIVTAMASSSVTASGVGLYGIRPEEEKRITDVPKQIVNGSYFTGSTRNPVVIGLALAKELDLKTGSKMVLTFQDDSGSITGGAFRVVGIFRTVSSGFDKTATFVRVEDLQRLIGSGAACHELAVLLKPKTSVDSVAALLRTGAKGLEVDTWKQLAPDLAYVSESLAAMLYVFMIVILAALAFGIVNTMLMVVLERRREFGMLMAVGMPRGKIFSMIVLETVVLSLTGAGIGMALTVVMMGILGRTGIDLSILSEGLSRFGIAEVLYPSLPASMYAVLTAMAVATAIGASIYPAVKALRLRPSEALRSV